MADATTPLRWTVVRRAGHCDKAECKKLQLVRQVLRETPRRLALVCLGGRLRVAPVSYSPRAGVVSSPRRQPGRFGYSAPRVPMAYQIYFADLTEENRALVLTLLRLKEESGKLEPGEEELLAKMREEAALLPQSEFSEVREPFTQRQGRPSISRRGSGNGRGR